MGADRHLPAKNTTRAIAKVRTPSASAQRRHTAPWHTAAVRDEMLRGDPLLAKGPGASPNLMVHSPAMCGLAKKKIPKSNSGQSAACDLFIPLLSKHILILHASALKTHVDHISPPTRG